jgi:catechol 2,3-dioxygenase-like lactoylglutathione lyase family enzyme
MPVFGRISPTIPVADIDRALRFYCEVLGFAVGFTIGDPVSFAVIEQGEAQLHLCVQPAKAGSSHNHVLVDDLDGVYGRLQQAGVAVQQPPMNQPWGLRDLVVADPDGNTFEVAEPVIAPASA